MQNKYESVTRPQQYKSPLGLNRYQHNIENMQTIRVCLLSFPLILPCLGASVVWFGTGLMGAVDKELVIIMASAGLGAGLFLLLLFLPAICVKRTATPSAWQRFCRFYLFHIAKVIVYIFLFSIWLLLFLTNQSKEAKQDAKNFNTYFKYWLSHPDKELSPEQCEQIIRINTDAFDWQDPTQWPV